MPLAGRPGAGAFPILDFVGRDDQRFLNVVLGHVYHGDRQSFEAYLRSVVAGVGGVKAVSITFYSRPAQREARCL